MNEEYKVVSEFFCYGKQIVTVMLGNAAHTINKREWIHICALENQNKNNQMPSKNRYPYNKRKVLKAS